METNYRQETNRIDEETIEENFFDVKKKKESSD